MCLPRGLLTWTRALHFLVGTALHFLIGIHRGPRSLKKVSPQRDRDYSREAPTGNSLSYAVRRLQRAAKLSLPGSAAWPNAGGAGRVALMTTNPARRPVSRQPLVPRVKVWLEAEGDYAFGFGLAEILRAVDQAGSIKQATAHLGKSYRPSDTGPRLISVTTCGIPPAASNTPARLTEAAVCSYVGSLGGGNSTDPNYGAYEN